MNQSPNTARRQGLVTAAPRPSFYSRTWGLPSSGRRMTYLVMTLQVVVPRIFAAPSGIRHDKVAFPLAIPSYGPIPARDGRLAFPIRLRWREGLFSTAIVVRR